MENNVNIRFAYDRSTRSFDHDGHLTVSSANFSKATINPYYGSEIPNSERLGLSPTRIYQLYRPPEELAKAAPTFAGKPLLSIHKATTANDHDRSIVIGAVGSNVRFEAPYLKAGLSVWDAASIAGIESGEQRELSAAYRYVPVMTPGTVNGQRFDGRMTAIMGNHVALVASGRAGSDVVVGDSAENIMDDQDTDRREAYLEIERTIKQYVDLGDPKLPELISLLRSTLDVPDDVVFQGASDRATSQRIANRVLRGQQADIERAIAERFPSTRLLKRSSSYGVS